METRVLVDSSVLIDFFRKRNKEKSALYRLAERHALCMSVITVFEVKAGIVSARQERDYGRLAANIEVLPLDEDCIEPAVEAYQDLKSRNALIGLADLLIAATAVRHDLAVATLNEKHFERVALLKMVAL